MPVCSKMTRLRSGESRQPQRQRSDQVTKVEGATCSRTGESLMTSTPLKMRSKDQSDNSQGVQNQCVESTRAGSCPFLKGIGFDSSGLAVLWGHPFPSLRWIEAEENCSSRRRSRGQSRSRSRAGAGARRRRRSSRSSSRRSRSRAISDTMKAIGKKMDVSVSVSVSVDEEGGGSGGNIVGIARLI